MKKIAFLMLSLSLFFTACEMNDALFPEEGTAGELKSGKVKMVPIKGDFYSVVKGYSTEGVPVYGNLGGVTTHLGKLIEDKSVWYTTFMSFDEITLTIKWQLKGSKCAANGDLLHYTLDGTFNILENQLTAVALIEGGTGRFEKAAGYMNITGYADNPAAITKMFMKGEGMISGVGSCKK